MENRPDTDADFAPPFCPRPTCSAHTKPQGRWFKKFGTYDRLVKPHTIQRFQCLLCRRTFSTQTFSSTYWLKIPHLLATLFHRSLACSAHRQIARDLNVHPTTVQRQIERLGRHCLLFQELHRPKHTPEEPLVADGFESFEFSQDYPCHFHLAVGANSHFFYAFTDSELRRKGSMTKAQKSRRQRNEDRYGRPDPKSIRKEMAQLLLLVAREPANLVLRTDEHRSYPPAIRDVPHLNIQHQTTPSTQARTSQNPLFPVNLLDLLIRHSGANHKRETIAYSKRRQAAAERLAIFQVWRNFIKPFSENKQGACPAQTLGLTDRRLDVHDILAHRLFPSLVGLPKRLMDYYRRTIPTRRIPNGRLHNLSYAF
jgi:transposase-like protein